MPRPRSATGRKPKFSLVVLRSNTPAASKVSEWITVAVIVQKMRELGMIEPSRASPRKRTEVNFHAGKIEDILTTAFHFVSIAFVLIIIVSEISRVSNYRSVFDDYIYIIFILFAGYTGVFVKSRKYNIIIICCSIYIVELSIKNKIFIIHGELGGSITSWNISIFLFILIGCICNFFYFGSRLVSFFLDRIEFLLPEKIKRAKKDSRNMLF